jgi:hypothetical protein
VYAAQSQPLRRADASLAQWEVHVGAMNQLVAGAITLKQAQRFWDQTRIGAQHRLDRFARAMRSYRARTARCVDAHVSPRLDPRIQHCVATVAARTAALRAADAAIDTWRLHTRHMEMLRMGEMSPQAATRLWLSSWHQGNQELKTYARAARHAQHLHGC